MTWKKCRMTGLLFGLLLLLLVSLRAGAENPLGFREYEESVTLRFASPEAAEAARLEILELPHPYKLAFSSRWDDSTQNHLRTLEVMRANGIRGTFYLCSAREFTAESCRKVLEAGCSLGLHTVSHPILPTLNPNRQFEEYMSNKIDIETVSQSPVNTQVFPFSTYTSPRAYTQLDLGKVLRTCGVIGGATIFYGALEKAIGYPAGTLAASRVVAPGDTRPDVSHAENEIAFSERPSAALTAQPSISIGIHSWHTPEGLKALDRVFKLRARRADYWYCNQNDYSAYRYEANQARVTKKVTGSEAVFTIRRIDPAELGAEVPLSLKLVGAPSPDCRNGVLSLPHDLNRRIPVRFDRAVDGVSALFPGVEARLAWENGSRLKLTFGGENAGAVSDVAVTFRVGPGWEKPVDRQDRADASNPEWTGTFGRFSPELRYQYGRAYGTAQIDFTLDGKRCRLYAECRGPAPEGLPPRLNEVAQLYMKLPETLDWEQLSTVGIEPASLELKEVNRWPNDLANEGLISVTSAETQALGGSDVVNAAVVFEFDAAEAGDCQVTTNAVQLYCNGKAVPLEKGKAIVPAVAGRNRIALRCNVVRWPNALYFYFNTGENPPLNLTLSAKK